MTVAGGCDVVPDGDTEAPGDREPGQDSADPCADGAGAGQVQRVGQFEGGDEEPGPQRHAAQEEQDEAGSEGEPVRTLGGTDAGVDVGDVGGEGLGAGACQVTG